MDRNLAKADRIAQGQATIEAMVEAAKPLYASFDEIQKHKFVTLGRMLVPERGQFVKAMRRLHCDRRLQSRLRGHPRVPKATILVALLVSRPKYLRNR